ncbi:serine protease [Diaphorobacter sp.]|uniref:trypsin-like serine peptidase n=1 Tax=Diaphorobacter sp. TaxID=1934310 RepID=UPI0028ADAFB5|nr:serine protease [Diaphorobacter sp.]
MQYPLQRSRWSRAFRFAVLPAVIAAFLTACGGSSGGSDASEPNDSFNPSTTEYQVDAIVQKGSIHDMKDQVSLTPEVVKPTVVNLGNLVRTKEASNDLPDGVAKVGVSRESVLTSSWPSLKDRLAWSFTTTQGRIAALRFISRGAQEVRIGVVAEQVPPTALFRTYPSGERASATQITGEQIASIIASNRMAGDHTQEGRTWWAPGVEGDDITLEIELPSDVNPADLKISIPSVIHVYGTPALALPNSIDPEGFEPRALGDSAKCHKDASCYSEHAAANNSVIVVKYLQNRSYFQCTGTLLNNTLQNRVPYVVTANHCISTQTAASTIESTWFFRAKSCGDKKSGSYYRSNKGARLLYTTANPDFTLLQLNDTPPVGATFAGWSSAPLALGSKVAGIQHPRSDLQKIAIGSTLGTRNCSIYKGAISCSTPFNSFGGNMFRVMWSEGLTESGSSGSGIFNNNRLAGVLSGGTSTCAGGEDLYSRFDLVFPSIRQWLAPSR